MKKDNNNVATLFNNKTEAKIQQECYVWFVNNYGLKKHNPRCVMFSVPNEIAMMIGSIMKYNGISVYLVNKVVAQVIDKMKSTGMKAGVSDAIVLIPKKTLYVEFKTEIGVQSDKQKEFEVCVRGLNQEYHIVRSLEQFKEIINEASK